MILKSLLGTLHTSLHDGPETVLGQHFDQAGR